MSISIPRIMPEPSVLLYALAGTTDSPMSDRQARQCVDTVRGINYVGSVPIQYFRSITKEKSRQERYRF